MRRQILQIGLAAGLLAIIAPARADRAPTPDERNRIEAALKADGFTRWKGIERDDGVWEVDDAIGPDGQEYDIKLDQAFKIIKKERD